jgi:heterodisulfide reductase subunit A
LTYTEVDRVEGEAGEFRATLITKPRYIIEDKCTGCTTCVEYCPVQVPDPYNQELSTNKAVHVYFSQAIPLITYIDENCLYLKEKKCLICEGVCKNDAIDLHQEESSGLEPFDPKVRGDYGYGKMPNVVTSMDFERLLSATGPFEGEVLRPSDNKHPHKIAWIQCVGSRQVREGGNSYCSAVCCTYTQKQVILLKDHNPGAECTIFHNDIRSHGKDFERYYQRAEDLSGVRFVRSYVSIGKEIPETKNVTIRYASDADGVKEEEFDLVVLSVGLTPPDDVKGLADKFGIELNSHGFSNAIPFNPMETNRPGIYVSGALQGPIDIPESVFTASGAGAQCGELLNRRRGELARERIYPPEKDVSKDEPKIGVFVCHCGANIGRVVDVPSAVEYALTLPNRAQPRGYRCLLPPDT